MIRITIPAPCPENWANMKPDNNGRFCTSCEKIVVDFTQMNDDEVKNYLLNSVNKNTCGRFYNAQLGRSSENQTLIINDDWYRELPFAKQVFYAVAVFFVLGVSSCNFSGTTLNKSIQDTSKQSSISVNKDTMSMPGKIAINEKDTMNKVRHTPLLIFSEPTITGDIAMEEPIPTGEVNMGVPEWVEQPDTIRIKTGKFTYSDHDSTNLLRQQ